jgi:hypothetical protein
LAKGINFTRIGRALAMGNGDPDVAARISRKVWGEDAVPTRILKAGGPEFLMAEKAEIPAGSTASGSWSEALVAFEGAAAEFFTLVKERSLLGRLTSLRRVPLRVRLVSPSTGFGAMWTGEGKAKAIGRAVFAQDSLPRFKISSLAVVTTELLEAADVASELTIRDDMARAMAEAIDASFITPSSAGTAGLEPSSVAFGAPSEAASGDTVDDIRDAVSFMIRNFDGDLSEAYFIGRPELFAHIGLNAGLMTEQLGARGGTLGGVPCLPSKQLPLDANGKQQLVLLDPTSIAYGEDGMELRTSREGSVEMLDTGLQGSAIADVNGASMVSLWQTGSVALLTEKYLNWQAGRTGSVRVLTGLEGGLVS